MSALLIVSQNGLTASGHPRSGSPAYLDQVLWNPLRLATSTKRRIVTATLPGPRRLRSGLKTPVSAYETLFLSPNVPARGLPAGYQGLRARRRVPRMTPGNAASGGMRARQSRRDDGSWSP